MRWLNGLLAATFLTCGDPATANNQLGRWFAYSRTATSITGNIVLSETHLRAAGHNIRLRQVAALPEFDAAYQGHVSAQIFELVVPTNPKLVNGNQICGEDPVRWISVWSEDDGKALEVAAFSSADLPHSLSDPGLCATFRYFR